MAVVLSAQEDARDNFYKVTFLEVAISPVSAVFRRISWKQCMQSTVAKAKLFLRFFVQSKF